MRKLVLQIFAGIGGLWLADRFIAGVDVTKSMETLVLAGTVLGIINSFIKPTIKIIALPIQLITFGLFGFAINMIMVWIVDILFPELMIVGIKPLFLTSILVWGLGFILTKWLPEK